MSGKKQYVLAVPNFSEGRSTEIVNKIVDSIRNLEGLKLISVEPEEDFNRTVVTMFGEPQVIKHALVELGKAAVANIDMTKQKGTKGRYGSNGESLYG